jgi:hypothetical protein
MSKVVKSITKAVTSVVKSVVKAVAKVASTVVSFVTQPFMGSFGNQGNVSDAQQETQRQQGVLVTIQGGGDVSIPVVYGLRQIGGVVFWAETGSDSNKYLWVGYALSEGPIEGIYQLSIEDEDITMPDMLTTLNSGGQYTLNKPGSRYSGRCVFQFWPGIYKTNVYDLTSGDFPGNKQHLLANSPTWRDGENVMNGVAVLMARYEWKSEVNPQGVDNNPFSGGIPNIKVTLMGKRVQTLSLTSPARNLEYDQAEAYGSNVVRYSTNPAEILYDYLRNPRYGKGMKNSELDYESFSLAATKYNEGVGYAPGIAGPIVTCNYVLDTNQSIMANVKTLLQGQRGYMPFVQGKYKLKVEDAGNPTSMTSGSAVVVATFTKDDIIGDITFGGVERSAQYTEVEVTFVSPQDKWANQTAYFPTTSAERLAAQTATGGRVNRGAFTFPTLTNYYMAEDMAELLYNKSRWQQTCSLKVSARAMELEPGDNIYIRGVVLDFYDSNLAEGENVPWRIVSTRLNDDYTIDLDCVRNPDFIYPYTQKNVRDTIARPFIPTPGGPFKLPELEYPIDVLPPGNHSGTVPGTIPDNGLQPVTPTNPSDATNGGGVGGVDQPQGSNIAPIIPPPPPMTDIIDITEATYTKSGTTVRADVKFTQPTHPQYNGVTIWYKRDSVAETVWTKVENLDKPGGGQTVTQILDGLIASAVKYRLIVRVMYQGSNGAVIYSERKTEVVLDVSGAVSTEAPIDTGAFVYDGWTEPSTTFIAPPPSDRLEYLSAVPTYSSPGVLTTNRGLVFTITQDIITQRFNQNVRGINIYYRVNGTIGYKLHTHYFTGNYYPGTPYSFTPSLDLGVSGNDSTDQFDFVFRLFYDGLKESDFQIRVTNSDIENTTNTPVMGYGPGSVQTQQLSSVLVNWRVFTDSVNQVTLEDPASVVDLTLTQIGVQQVRIEQAPNRLEFYIDPPNVANRPNWRGVRLRYRIIPADGSRAGDFSVEDVYPVFQDADGWWKVRTPELSFKNDYQFVLTPVMSISGVKTESKYSILAEGRVDPDRAADVALDNGTSVKTGYSTVLTFKYNFDTANVSSLIIIPINTTVPTVKRLTKVFNSGTTQTANNCYFELQYFTAHIAGLTNVKIYRRSDSRHLYPNTSAFAKYFGLGRWEEITVNPAPFGTSAPYTGYNAITQSDGSILINLRAPISHAEFTSTGTPLIRDTGLWSTGKYALEELSGATSGTTTVGWDYVMVTTTGSGQSVNAVRLPVIHSTNTSSNKFAETVPFATYDGYDAGFKRKITLGTDGSRTSIANASLMINSTTAYTAPTAFRGAAVV